MTLPSFSTCSADISIEIYIESGFPILFWLEAFARCCETHSDGGRAFQFGFEYVDGDISWWWRDLITMYRYYWVCWSASSGHTQFLWDIRIQKRKTIKLTVYMWDRGERRRRGDELIVHKERNGRLGRDNLELLLDESVLEKHEDGNILAVNVAVFE